MVMSNGINFGFQIAKLHHIKLMHNTVITVDKHVKFVGLSLSKAIYTHALQGICVYSYITVSCIILPVHF